jgi:hypothetical protein
MIWGGLLILGGVLSLWDYYADISSWLWVGILTVAGLIILGVYLTDRSDLILLIPSYVLFVIAGIIAAEKVNFLSGEGAGTIVLFAIGLPFLVVYLRDRRHWWAGIPAYVMFVIGLMVGLLGLNVLSDNMVTVYVMFAIAIPFFVVYLRNRSHWWALIPGGVMSIIGLAFLFSEAAFQIVAAAALVIGGILIIARMATSKEPQVPETIDEGE